MLIRARSYWPLWLASLALASTAWAQSAQISSELQVQQVETVDGQTVLKPATVTKPGDVLEYRVSYSNHSASAVTGLIANLPIPAGTTLVDRSQLPPDALASTDGALFAPLPLTRLVRQPDGTSRTVPVPLEEYRALRWKLGTLLPGRSTQVSARVRVNGALPPVAAAAARPNA
jgi:uncharacterized repeat protein (TIGR01451 family)